MDEIGNMIFQNQKMAEADNKDAILVMSFGTAFSEARKNSLDVIICDIKKAFPEKKVQLSFSSKRVVKHIFDTTGEVYLTNEQALKLLENEGYTRVVMLSLELIPGHEYDDERDLFCMEQNKFKLLALGTPLMYWTGAESKPDDLSEVFEAVRSYLPATAEDEAILLMGHGSSHWANDYYWILQEKITRMGINNIFIYTLESSPDIDDVIHKLRKGGFNKVVLVPLLMTAGKHVIKDMCGSQPDSHRSILEIAGFEVTEYIHGMGEASAIRELIIRRAKKLCSSIF